MNIHTSSGAIIYIVEEGIKKVLVMKRSSTDSWHLPKGTQNKGETLQQTAIREIKEETGYDVVLEEYIGKLDSKYERDGVSVNKETHYFLATPIGLGVSTPDTEHDIICFLDYHSALSHLEHFSLYEEEGKILKTAEYIFV